MKAAGRTAGASAALFATVIAMRIVIQVSPGAAGRAYISLVATLLGFGIGLGILSIALMCVRMQIVRAERRALRVSPGGYVVTFVTDRHFDDALAELNITRYSRAHYLSLAADSEGVRIVGTPFEGVIAALPWKNIRSLSVGVGSTRRSLRRWANLVIRVDLGEREVRLPVSVLPNRRGGILTPAQIVPVLDGIESQRPLRSPRVS